MRAAGRIEDILGLVVGKLHNDRANKNGAQATFEEGPVCSQLLSR
jgi:hypothetical protein